MNFVIFISGTIVLIFFTWWFSLKNKRYHGIYRFFALESIFAMILMNSSSWFSDPFSVSQLFSWSFLTLSLVLAIHGFYLLYRIGQPEIKQNAETTTRLVKRGAYHYIRHPLYASLILLCLGVYLKQPSMIGTILLLVTTLSAFMTAKVEEQEMIRKFGREYEDYIQTTSMFIPRII